MTEAGELTPFERADAALREMWAEERAEKAKPVERYRVSFKSGWAGCAEVMSALGAYERWLSGVEWTHGPQGHAVVFACTWDVLKNMQTAMKGAVVSELKCTRA